MASSNSEGFLSTDLRSLRTPLTVGFLLASSALLFVRGGAGPSVLQPSSWQALAGSLSSNIASVAVTVLLLLLLGTVSQALLAAPTDLYFRFLEYRLPRVTGAAAKSVRRVAQMVSLRHSRSAQDVAMLRGKEDDFVPKAMRTRAFDVARLPEYANRELAERLIAGRRARRVRTGIEFDMCLWHLSKAQVHRVAQANRQRSETEYIGAVSLPLGLFGWGVVLNSAQWSLGERHVVGFVWLVAIVAWLGRTCHRRLRDLDLVIDYWVSAGQPQTTESTGR